MLMSRDDDKGPPPSPEMFDFAKRHRLLIVKVVCYDKEEGGSEFLQLPVAVECVPRAMESIVLQNGRTCVVSCVSYAICVHEPGGEEAVPERFATMVPTVHATLLPEGKGAPWFDPLL